MQDGTFERQAAASHEFLGEIEFSRAAYDTFLRLDADTRRLVSLAPRAAGNREIAPGIFSSDAGPGLRVVFRREAQLASILALTGRRTA
ncbi:MAG: hypothetical protein U0942_03700 [Parvibaculum sp.]|jgi:hypothetical protein|uniref:hypothetical protein n=1 Tax=Parvibaculum sp. TaxID=2024848 RepID=UPI002AB8BE8C|nr:hypothetical protein [Parvibaculum sp.]MDZ4380423.1 hypothetical protein [Parvibaculum sp.]